MTPAEIAGTVVSVLTALGGAVVAVGRWVGAREERRDAAMSVLGHARRTHSLRHLVGAFQERFHGDLQLPEAYRFAAHG